MKKIGLVGGIGPASTVEYYLKISEKTLKETGEYPEIVIDSVNMLRHDRAFDECNLDIICDSLLQSVRNLANAGAEVAAITANTEHIVFESIRDRFVIPVISIVDAAVDELSRKGCKRVLVFGTAWILSSGLYEKALTENGIDAIIPSTEDIEAIGKLIYPNLENGIVIPEDREALIKIAEQYIAKEKADALLLACTELPLAVHEGDVSVPVIDTTVCHIDAVLKMALLF